MKLFLSTLATAMAVSGSVTAQFVINTPLNVIVCEPVLISWSGGTPPYFLSVLPANKPSAPALRDFGEVSGHSLTWIVDIAAKTSIFLNLRDSAGFLAQSGTFTVQASRNTSCLGY